MESFEVNLCIQGYHVYQLIWIPVDGEILLCARETGNRHNPFSVKANICTMIVGHLPKRISSTCSLFYAWVGTFLVESLEQSDIQLI